MFNTVLALLAVGIGPAATTAPIAGTGPLVSATAAAGIERLAFYDGTWRLTAEALATPVSKAAHISSTVANRCTRFMQHLTCEQTVDGVPAGLLVFSFDAATSRYASLPVAPDGSGHSAAIEVGGDGIAFPWMQEVDGKTVRFRVTNMLTTPDTIAYRKEYAPDGTTWLPIETGTEHRVGR